MHASFVWNSTIAQKTTAYQTASNVTQMMRDISPGSGAYFVRGFLLPRTSRERRTHSLALQNEGDTYETDHEFSYWGDNYPRLLSLKHK